jgi:hypothetical protein
VSSSVGKRATVPTTRACTGSPSTVSGSLPPGPADWAVFGSVRTGTGLKSLGWGGRTTPGAPEVRKPTSSAPPRPGVAPAAPAPRQLDSPTPGANPDDTTPPRTRFPAPIACTGPSVTGAVNCVAAATFSAF